MTRSVVKIGLIQMPCESEPKKNLEKAIHHIHALARQGSQIVCLQELFTSLYFCQTEDHKHFDLAESVPGSTTERLSEVAKKDQVVIVASLFEKRTKGVYHNTTAVLDADGRYLGKYRKMHIPDDPCFYEKFYFTPGDLGYQVFQTKYAKLGVLICWDQWYPEAARMVALKGADIIVYPTAIGCHINEKEKFGSKQMNAWKSVQTGHAIANEVFVVTPNRVGREGDLEFWGNSFVVDPFGETLYQAGVREELAVIDCNLNLIEETRLHWPFMRDRRIDSYASILKRVDD